jgi:hypothetical protein
MTEKEIRNQFLQELDAFTHDWIEVFKKNNIPIGQVGGIAPGYFRGDIEEIPVPMAHPRMCPICKQSPADMEVASEFPDAYQELDQEYLVADLICNCESEWKVTYKLLPIKKEEI